MKSKFVSYYYTSIILIFLSFSLHAEEAAYQIESQVFSVSDLYNSDADKFYRLEKEKYETISKVAEEKYFQYFWKKLAKDQGVDEQTAKLNYYDDKLTVSEKQIESTLRQFKDHPRLKSLTEKQKRRQISAYIETTKAQEIEINIIEKAKKSGELVILYPEPKEPRYRVDVSSNDPIKYGPKSSDVKPLGCSEDCAITLVQYSDFECPYCKKIQTTLNMLMTDFRGKIRLVARDYPLDFHDRARPAAIAARCAQDQGKFWEMSAALYKGDLDLKDSYFIESARKIGLNLKTFEQCIEKPEPALKRIEQSIKTGQRLGVSGTPAFFVNGRSISGTIPYRDFKQLIENELLKNK